MLHTCRLATPERNIVYLFSSFGKPASGHQAVALQVDSFNRHASGKGGGKLSRLFSTKKSPRGSPSPNGPATPQPSGGSISLDDMLLYQPVSCCCPAISEMTLLLHVMCQALGMPQSCQCCRLVALPDHCGPCCATPHSMLDADALCDGSC